jgi:phosphonate degradation associated HDIG domain protein
MRSSVTAVSAMTPLSLDDILEAFDRLGGRLYGENVSQREHALQAAQHAAEDGAPESLVAAALLHDYGHLLEAQAADRPKPDHPDADARHEALGAMRLKTLFGPEITGPIALHVAAKRYLCSVEPGYLAGLSEASRHSLILQGGPFSRAQAARFAARPHAAAAIRLRRYDDLAKVVGAATPDLSSYIPMLARLSVQATLAAT